MHVATNTSDALAEANPPFVPELRDAMVVHMESLLEVAEAAGEALSFAVLVPRWAQLPFHRRLERSRWCRLTLSITASEHGFFDGAQHEAGSAYRPSSFDSSVFFLQTESGRAAWPATAPVVQEFRAAMAKALPATGGSIEQWERKVKPLAVSGEAAAGEVEARRARAELVRSAWVALPPERKAAEWGGSFRKYKKQALAEMLAARGGSTQPNH